MNTPADRPVHRSTEANAELPFWVPHPLENLSGVRVHTKPIPQDVYDHVMKRDAQIFERLAKV